MAPTSLLFSGDPQPLGGLSNEADLAKHCPQEFRNGNPWSTCAEELFLRGTNAADWAWRSADGQVRRRQNECLLGLLGTFDLPHDDKIAIAGWMLSEMLTRVPRR